MFPTLERKTAKTKKTLCYVNVSNWLDSKFSTIDSCYKNENLMQDNLLLNLIFQTRSFLVKGKFIVSKPLGTFLVRYNRFSESSKIIKFKNQPGPERVKMLINKLIY